MDSIRYERIAGIVGFALGAMLLATSSASAATISFNDFYHDPLSSVVIAPDGSAVQLAENGEGSPFLSNIPILGDPNVIVAQSGAKLSFNFDFSESGDNDDLFHVAILDGNTGAVFGPAFEYFFSSSASGLIEFDLSSLLGLSLGLQFELASNPDDSTYTSTLMLSNLQINLPPIEPPEEPPTSVPEPSLVSLFLLGLVLFGVQRRGVFVRRRRAV